MVLRLKKLAARSGSSAALYRFIGHILLSVLSGNTCVLPTLIGTGHYYFNKMRSSFQTWFKISFFAHETQYLQKNLSESQQQAGRS
jgi:hypothetical protein